MKNKKTTWVFFFHNHSKFWSVWLEHFIERKPLIFEERIVILFVSIHEFWYGINLPVNRKWITGTMFTTLYLYTLYYTITYIKWYIIYYLFSHFSWERNRCEKLHMSFTISKKIFIASITFIWYSLFQFTISKKNCVFVNI